MNSGISSDLASVAYPDPGSGALFTPGSGIPNQYFFVNLAKQKMHIFKNEIIFNLVKFMATKKR
jgi:hypothetical protein